MKEQTITRPTLLWTCVVGAHIQCVNNHYPTFKYKDMKFVLDTVYTQIIQFQHYKGGVQIIMSKFNTPKYIIKCAQKRVRMFNA